LSCESEVEARKRAQVFKSLSAIFQVLHEHCIARRKFKQLEGKTQEWTGFLCDTVRSTNEIDMLDDAIDNIRFVERKALLFVKVRVDDAILDGLFHNSRGIEAVWRDRYVRATLIEEATRIGVNCIFVSAHCV